MARRKVEEEIEVEDEIVEDTDSVQTFQSISSMAWGLRDESLSTVLAEADNSVKIRSFLLEHYPDYVDEESTTFDMVMTLLENVMLPPAR